MLLLFLIALLSYVEVAFAHMSLKEPTPYADYEKPGEPLDPANPERQFACKIPPSESPTTTDWKVGPELTVDFEGAPIGPNSDSPKFWAIHNGGSCQLSITKDSKPTKDSVFKVLHSVVGNCPGTGSGNGTAVTGTGEAMVQAIKFTLKEWAPNGLFVLAWTWFNHTGNREMYMECAMVQISGGSDESDAFDKLPDMQIANYKDPSVDKLQCKTKDSMNLMFENLGESLDMRVADQSMMAPLICEGGGGGGMPPPPAPVTSSPAAAPEEPALATPEVQAAPETPPESAEPAVLTENSAPAPAAAGPGRTCTVDEVRCTGRIICNDDFTLWGTCDQGCVKMLTLDPLQKHICFPAARGRYRRW